MSDPRPPMDLTHDELLELGAAFVLDALDPDELEAVRAHLASCPLDHGELAELASVVPLLAEDIPQVEPPAGLRDRILAAAAADAAGAEPATATAVAASSGPITAAPAAAAGAGPSTEMASAAPIAFPSAEERTARAERTRTSRGTWILRIAAVLAIVALTGWNLLLQGQLSTARTFEQQVASVVDAASQPGSLTAVLRPATGGPSGIAAITADGDMSIALRDLPATTGSQVYEAWMIGGDGVPIALGGFPQRSDGTAYMEAPGIPTSPGIVIALTLEPNAGNTAPAGPVVTSGTTTATG
jgi:Anti-sigma-K factor rskA, C-terminal/Putative zinc-finger